jgi:hypothetical protein
MWHIFGQGVKDKDMYRCPVCGYRGLRQPPEDHLICPCCGTQFGYSDAGERAIAQIHAGLRKKWIDRKHAQWQSRNIARPQNWNAWLQLVEANFTAEIPWLRGLSVSMTTRYEPVVAEILTPFVPPNPLVNA